jgi:hypothetical protein
MCPNFLRPCSHGSALAEPIRKGVHHYATGTRSVSVRKPEFPLGIAAAGDNVPPIPDELRSQVLT